jgi:hypothetical protein
LWARASALNRHLECPAASWLPRDENGNWVPGYLQKPEDFIEPFEDNAKDSVFAEWGTKMHLAKENSPIAEQPFLGKMEPHRERLWPLSLGKHEISISYNCRTGQVIEGPTHGANAWKRLQGPDTVTGTADWVGTIPCGDLWIDDLKTGHATPDPASVQLKFYAMAFYKLRGYPKSKTKQVRTSVTHWRREWDEPKRIWTILTWAQLEEFEQELILAWRHAIGKEPHARPGIHCAYCPSLQVCDAINGIEYEKIGLDDL